MIALPVSERDELLLRVVDLPKDGQLGGQIAGADGGGPLMDDVLEEVRHAVEPHRLLHGADPYPQVGGHPRYPVVFDNQDREAVAEHVLLNLERSGGGLAGDRGNGPGRGRWRRRFAGCGRCQGSNCADEEDDEQGSHGL